MNIKTKEFLGCLFFLCFLSGCAGTLRSYHGELQKTINLGQAGNIDAAVAQLDEDNKSENKDLLYYLEKGELLNLKNSFSDSLEARLKADEKIKIWEDETKLTAEKVGSNVGSLLVNDKVRRYDGRDYEKVFLTSRLVSNRLLIGDWDAARVEVKKMHERETLISDLRAKEIEKAEQEANKKGIQTTYKDLKGYPVELLDDPEVEKLKNSYQNAFAHYLAGYIYESLGERSLAAAGYRKSIELKPNINVLEESLKNVDNRYKNLSKSKSDVLVIYESGLAPSYESLSIPLPVPTGTSFAITPISFPVVKQTDLGFVPKSLKTESTEIEISEITNVNTMAKRALKDEMPGIIVRSVVRATSKALAQKAANDNDSTGVSGLILMIGGLIVEGADERTWRTLPSTVSVGRAILSRGQNKLIIPTVNGNVEKVVDITSRYTVVGIRSFGNSIYLSQANSPEQIDLTSEKELTEAREKEAAIERVAKPVVTEPKGSKKMKSTKKQKAS